MKIIGISSGSSYNGYTANLVRVALQAAVNRGAQVEEIYLPDYEIKICKGCLGCLAKGRCGINDDLELIRQKLSQSDGIIIGTQAFGSKPDPATQNFLNRMGLYTQYTSTYAGKYLLTIATTEAFGAKTAARRLTELVAGYFKTGHISGILGFNVSWEQIERYPEYLRKTERFTQKLVSDIQNKQCFYLSSLVKHLHNKLFQARLKKLVLAQKDGKMAAVYQELNTRGWIGDSAATAGSNINFTAAARP